MKNNMFSAMVPLFKRRVYFYLGDETFSKFQVDCLKRHNHELEVDNKSADGMVLGGNVWIQDPRDHGVVAHEIFHVTENIAESAGVEDSETKAYILGWLTDVFYRKTRGADTKGAHTIQVGGEDEPAPGEG